MSTVMLGIVPHAQDQKINKTVSQKGHYFQQENMIQFIKFLCTFYLPEIHLLPTDMDIYSQTHTHKQQTTSSQSLCEENISHLCKGSKTHINGQPQHN